MLFIESPRLKLIPLTNQLLQYYYSDKPTLESVLGVKYSDAKIDPVYAGEIEDALLNFWLPKTLEFPNRFQWFTTWEIILKDTNCVVGGIGFNGYPNESQEVEIGYMIYENYRNNGYATEALHTLMQWAIAQEEVAAIVIRTGSDNVPSIKILERNRLDFVGEVENLRTYKFLKN